MNPKRTNPKGTLRTPGSRVAQERLSSPGRRVGQGQPSSPEGRVVRQERLSLPGRRVRQERLSSPGGRVVRQERQSLLGRRCASAAIALALFIAGGGVSFAQTTYYVATCGDDSWAGTSSTCSSPNGPKATIGAAVTAASSGDTIRILDGTYQGTGNKSVVINNKSLTIRSDSGDPEDVVIDCQDSGRAFRVTPSSSVTFEGLTFRNGDATDEANPKDGGAIQSDGDGQDFTIRNCVFENCHAESGGAIDLEKYPHVIEGCTFRGNTAANNGGAIFVHSCSSLTIEDCVFEALGESPHQAKNGGAIYAVNTTLLTLRNCTIDGSRAEDSGNGHGGGLSAYGCASVVMEDCIVSNNSSDNDGGGCYFFEDTVVTNPKLVRCTITDNTAEGTTGPNGGGGGGILIGSGVIRMDNCVLASNTSGYWGGAIRGWDVFNDSTLVNCVFTDNQGTEGGAIHLDVNAAQPNYFDVTNCTFWSNRATSSSAGGAIKADTGGDEDKVRLRNNIFWDDTANGSANEIVPTSGLGAVTYNCVEGGYSGTGNINADPLFSDAAGGDYRLMRGSPCLDAADKDALPADALDLDGDANTAEEIPYDLLDTARRKDHFCTTDTGHGSGDKTDMGAYEANKGLIHVDKDATGDNDGSSWAHAYVDLKNGLKHVGDDTYADYDPASCEIWVAEGTYKPSGCASCGVGDRVNTFALVDGVGVYGGFDATETQRSQRDPDDHETILTGAIGTTVVNWVYHVVTADNAVTEDAVLDGFTIKLGRANNTGTDEDKGGGLLISGSPTLGQLIIKQNLAKNGGGVYIKSGNPSFTDCSFIDNDANNGSGGGNGAGLYIASGGSGAIEFLRCNLNNNTSLDHGAGVYVASSGGTEAEPRFTNCLFYRNDADHLNDSTTKGGAIYTNRKIVLLQCTLAKNWCGADDMGGGIYNAGGNSILRNCILWKNFTTSGESHNNEEDQILVASGDVDAFESCIEDLDTLDESGHNNTPFDPEFQGFNSDNYALKGDNCSGGECLSFAVDDGEDDYCEDECEDDGDLNKATRKIDLEPNGEQVDMGALETQSG